MESLNLWCKLVVSVSVVSAVLSLFVPEGSLKKAFNTLLTMILVLTLLYPFSGKGIDDFSFAEKIMSEDNYNKEIDAAKDTALIYAAQTETEKYLKDILLSYGIECGLSTECVYRDDRLIIVSVTVNGFLNDEEIKLVLDEVNKISDDETEVIFNGG